MTTNDRALDALERDLELAYAATVPDLTFDAALARPAIKPPIAHRMTWRLAGAGALAAGLVAALAFLPDVFGGPEAVNAQELVNRSARATAALSSTGSYHMVYVTRGQGVETITETWQGGDNRYRTMATSTFADGSTTVDGSAVLGDQAWFVTGPAGSPTVAHGPRLMSVRPPETVSMDQLLQSWTENNCYAAELAPSERVIGRPAQVVVVTPTPATCSQPPKGFERVTLWIDAETMITLQMRMEALNPELESYFGVTLFESFEQLPDSAFAFEPPAGANVVSYSDATELKTALGGVLIVPRGSSVTLETAAPITR